MTINCLLDFGSVMSTVGSVLLAILILLLMITVHELGHYTAGKIFKFGIKEFAIGFGPALFKRKKKDGEIFSLRAFPLGGYCAFEGEDADDASPTAFNNQKPWKRIIVLVSGALMNFVTAYLLVVILFSFYGQTLLSTFEVKTSNEPIYTISNSFSDGDIIVKADGKNVYMTSDLRSALDGKKKGEEVAFTVLRGGEEITLNILVRADINVKNSADVGNLYEGIGLATLVVFDDVADNSPFQDGDYLTRTKSGDYEYDTSLGTEQPYFNENRIYDLGGLCAYLRTFDVGDTASVWVNRFDADGNVERIAVDLNFADSFAAIDKTDDAALLEYFGITAEKTTTYNRLSTSTARLGVFATIGRAFIYSIKIAGTIFKVLGELITGALGLNAMGGTITTIAMTSQIVRNGFNYFLEIAAYIGVNLAVFNLLPIPALDGSRVVFTLIEWIRRKPVNRNVEAVIHFVGLIVLIAFAVLVDLLQLF